MVAQRQDIAAAVATATLRLVHLRDNDPWHQQRRADQTPPPGDWRWWLLMAGRGFGKTRTGAEFVREEIMERRARRVALVGATAADVRDVMIEGESGLIEVCRRHGLKTYYEPSKRKVTFANGAVAKTYSAEEPDRLRGPQHDLAWADEVAAWENGKDTWDQLQFGLRLGLNPRGIATTTPRPVPVVKDLMAQRTIYYDDEGVAQETDDPMKAVVVVTSGSTYANIKNLPPAFAAQIIRRYEGTRLGRQEIQGELLLDVPGALWTYDMMSLLNRERYDGQKLYLAAQLTDDWDDTPPEEGTSVRAGCDIARRLGMWRVIRGKTEDHPTLDRGIAENRWATSVEEIAACLSPADEGDAILDRGWVRLVNSWGLTYPEVRLDLDVLHRLVFAEQGEATVVTDVPNG